MKKITLSVLLAAASTKTQTGGQACDFAILERRLRDHSTIQQWRVTENRKSQA